MATHADSLTYLCFGVFAQILSLPADHNQAPTMSSRNNKKPKSSRSRGQKAQGKTPSHTAQILEHVELLVALHGEKNESEESLTTADTDALVDTISQKLETQLEKRFDALEDQISNSDSDSNSDSKDDSQTRKSTLKSILKRFDSLESKLTEFEKSTNQDAGTEIEERFKALDQRLDKITSAIEGQQKLIEEQNQNSRGKATQENSDPSDSDENDPKEPNWNKQKQAMLSKYGIDPEHRPDMAAPTAPDPVLETTMADEELSAETKLDIKDTFPEDPQDIKKELNEKLRESEVKLSIARAKLSQLEAELESKQVELDRRDSELKEWSERRQSSSLDEEEGSIIDRLKKHLTAKDRKNLDRI